MPKILMIDDDSDIILATRLPLEAHGYKFYIANGGAEGLELVKAIKPDLIILDVVMSSTTEGIEVALKLRDRSPQAEYAAYRDIPILMFTAIYKALPMPLANEEDYLPIEAFLEKGSDPDELLDKVDELLKNKPTANC